MAEELLQVKLAKPERYFIKVYKDFFSSQLLTSSEKLVYIALKGYLDFKSDSGEVFPSIQTISADSGLNRKTVIKALQSLEEKGAITKERRGLTKSNLYTLNDNSQMWQAETHEEMKALSNSNITLTTEEMLEELQRRGAIEIVKKELSFTDQSKNESTSTIKYQVQSKCSIEDIKSQIEYDYLLTVRKVDRTDLDAVISIMYEINNTTKDTVRVSGEDKPKDVVVGVIRKLEPDDIVSVLDAYKKAEHDGAEIKNHEAYLTTMLYKAKLQNKQRLNNQGRNNHNW